MLSLRWSIFPLLLFAGACAGPDPQVHREVSPPVVDAPRGMIVPSVTNMAEVKALADQLYLDTDDFYLESLHLVKGRPGEEVALQSTFQLRRQSSAFRQAVLDRYNTPKYTIDQWKQLNRSYSQACKVAGQLPANKASQALWETISDTIGFLRHYYIEPGRYLLYPDHFLTPYYPGHPGYRHHPHPHANLGGRFPFRHPTRWHRHRDHYRHFSYRRKYRYGYGRFDQHYLVYDRDRPRWVGGIPPRRGYRIRCVYRNW